MMRDLHVLNHLRWRLLFLRFCSCWLFFCGDVEYKPGPGIRYPCGICYQSVRRNQKALLCDLCDFWIHCKCSGVSNQMYASYQRVDCFSWRCPRCLLSILPFHNCSFLNSADSFSTSSDVDDSSTERAGLATSCYFWFTNCSFKLS